MFSYIIHLYISAGREQDREVRGGPDAEGRGHGEGRENDLVLRAHQALQAVLHTHSQKVSSAHRGIVQQGALRTDLLNDNSTLNAQLTNIKDANGSSWNFT